MNAEAKDGAKNCCGNQLGSRDMARVTDSPHREYSTGVQSEP